jgi:hypothetical protein
MGKDQTSKGETTSRKTKLETSHLLISRKHEPQRRADWNMLEEKE